MKVMQGKVAIITGGTSGIGAATAELFAAEGATVVIGARRRKEGEALAAKLNGDFVRTDVSVEADVEALVTRTADRHGRLDVLVNSAGDPGPGGSPASVAIAERAQLAHAFCRSAQLGKRTGHDLPC